MKKHRCSTGVKTMLKKAAVIFLGFIMLLTLTACPDKEQSDQQKNMEKIPNTMYKASNELEQIITLLGGPMFSGRDSIEQMKNEQLQMLLETTQKYTTGTYDKEQILPSGGTEKGEQQQKEGSKSEKQGEENAQGEEQDNTKENGKKNEEGQGEEMQQEKGNDSSSEKDKGGQEKATEQNIEKENSGEKVDSQKPESEENKSFQYEDSLFGIPQWHDDNWKMIKVLTDGMHFTWNNLQPELIKKGVSQTQIENFNKALAALSQNVSAKNIMAAQNSAFELSQALADFYSYYKTDIPAELPRITSGVTGIHFSVKQNDWAKAQELANQLQQEFAKLKAGAEDNQNHIFQMLELSINDLCSAVYNQDSVLVIIRTNLVNSNIRELESKLSQKQE
ncbi:hypothetical protein CSTERTH_10220 [Thermoclostridium stercorarium subsp. thermolacticum DSM 2910]|jgi:hypothetical protein|uniref:Lipoprotein n=3 Tax=Thermoclostridium stercorarium TaxID=1510 RepID=A0A1B1YMK5_THEST|nr:hypothetical protein CSTERTH_10220 [Thermoclostridium stercorarium subsp. thermolacticum DSM 2910]ANX02010.1 hypothetical protein CSTERLE_10710 [Thermoclostridium stercorarium subsp. leptospartum DSM 9219]